MTFDADAYRHKEWLGLLQPVGLVVSPLALVKAQAGVDRSTAVALQQALFEVVSSPAALPNGGEAPCIQDFPLFAEKVLNWLPSDLMGAPDQEMLPLELSAVLPDYGETLRPTYAVRDPDTNRFILLVQTVATGLPLDEVALETTDCNGWEATVQAKFERLLRETQIPIGLLSNGTELRLVYAPRGESSGYLTFPVRAMTEIPGRPILGALVMLLGADRLFNVPTDRRLPKILSDSREYQAEVSTKLANQVLDALWELLRGFQAADATVHGALLQELAQRDPQHMYGGLITTLMRLVFLLYAEDKELMPNDAVYQQNYAVAGLYERLREDAGNYPDTMDHRYGAWPWLLSLFRLVYDGGGVTADYLPARHGQLFAPDEYPFLEGRFRKDDTTPGEPIGCPRIPDGFIYRLLDKLLMLDGERLSYRALDVEQIGSVYEAIMGFEVEVAQGASVAIRPKDIVVNIDQLLSEKPTERAKRLEGEAECKLSSKESVALKEAKTTLEIVTALDRKLSSRTPNLLPARSLYLQPGEERRRTGSHYTPRKLTQPIVETTLRPLCARLGEHPTAEQILDLKVCDLAMGSGAFLVEVCRQLAERLVAAWTREDTIKDIPDDVEPLLAARRLVAQRCLYGVDRNPFAVNLAKLSLWLVTLAKDRPFTFVDHALKCGDSLVGVTQAEIGSFGKIYTEDLVLYGLLKPRIERASKYRRGIQERDARTDEEAEEKVRQLKIVNEELEDARLIGDTIAASFFNGTSRKEREEKRKEYAILVAKWREGVVGEKMVQKISASLRDGGRPVLPFNWEIEFPEVFDRNNSGFDAIVGNPPFLGGKRITTISGEEYQQWLQATHSESNKNTDLAAHFFRRAFNIIRKGGVFGLIATNTIAQGDTRASGLRVICNSGGTIYNAQTRLKWPGSAAVVVSVVHICKGLYSGTYELDGRSVEKISAFLFPNGGNENPQGLLANSGKSFIGSYVLGMGFTFDDTNPDATPIAEMHRLIEKDPRNQERIFPYIGGEEVNSTPRQEHRRYVINFGEMSEEEARGWPDLMGIVEEKVKPERSRKDVKKYPRMVNEWWKFWNGRVELNQAIAQCDRVLVRSLTSKHFCFTFLGGGFVYDQTLIVFALPKTSTFGALSCRVHEVWTNFFGASLEERPRYNVADCFETFPFPHDWENNPILESVGKTYYEYRAALMVRNNQGLTETYNRFHDPAERDPEILRLRELHTELDRAVLAAYNWTDIDTTCGFSLDYIDTEEDELPPEARERIASGDLFFPTADDACAFDSIARTGRRKLPWRYKWPEATHDEVLARLLALNQQRAEQEKLAGNQNRESSSGATLHPAPRAPQRKRRKADPDSPQLSLFDPPNTTT